MSESESSPGTIEHIIEAAYGRREIRGGVVVMVAEDGTERCYKCGNTHRQQHVPARVRQGNGERVPSGWFCGWCGAKAPPPAAP